MESRNTLGYRLHALHNEMLRFLDQHARSCGAEPLTLSNILILDILYNNREKDVFQKDIEAECGVSRSTVAGIVKLMEQKGLLCRGSFDIDGRMKRLMLTEKGLQAYLEISGIYKEFEQKLAQSITPEEHAMLLPLLRRLQRGLQ